MTCVIGLISGTSVDGIDAALVNITGTSWDLKVELLAGATYPYLPELREQILTVGAGAAVSMAELAELDQAIALVFAEAAQKIQIGYNKAELIGSHGQTVYHQPPEGSRLGSSFQLGRGDAIAAYTGIETINNFRSGDIAVGGQGAPLVSKVDAYLIGHPQLSRCVQNIGGIGNVTYLPPVDSNKSWEEQILGWDTGPGNSLLDLAVQYLTNGTKTYDQDGQIAKEGTPDRSLVGQWLEQDYFQQPPPKSTGREQFGVQYFQQCLTQFEAHQLNLVDLLATLTELTVGSIVNSYRTFLPQPPQQVLLCGGGSRNLYLKHRLEVQMPSTQILTTDRVGLNADFKEAIAFAVLAYWRKLDIPGNLPQVTGATKAVLLGDIYPV